MSEHIGTAWVRKALSKAAPSAKEREEVSKFDLTAFVAMVQLCKVTPRQFLSILREELNEQSSGES